MPFCQGLWNDVCWGIMPVAFTAAITSNPKLLIAIKDQVFVRGLKWKRLSQLLDDPTARRMLRDVNVQDAPTIMTDDKEAVEEAECNRWHSESSPWIRGAPQVGFSTSNTEDQFPNVLRRPFPSNPPPDSGN